MQRLGLNKDGYRGEPLPLEEFLFDLEQLASVKGWNYEKIQLSDSHHLPLLHRPSESPNPRRFYVSSGIHGDEPAGPLAIKQLMEEDTWPTWASLWLWPCLNPSGFAERRRVNAQGIDINRDYLHYESMEARAHRNWLNGQDPFDVCLCLHEDWESDGFYLYELNPDGRPTPAQEILRQVATICPIDHASVIEGRPAQAGLIQPNLDPQSRRDWPEAFFLIQDKTRLCYTVEAPSDFPLNTRIAALAKTVETAMRFLA